MIERLRQWAQERNYRVAWGPVDVVERARRELLQRRETGELDESFFASELAALAEEESPPAGTSVVVVAVPRPAHRVRFRLDGGPADTLLPPTYVRYRATFEDVRQDLESHGLAGAEVEHLAWPIKAVAAHLGLVRYGRNNVTYAPGLGSYVQLCGFLTDAALAPMPDGLPAEPALLDECASCTACASACPTGAIDHERVLLHGERCLTCLNESAGDWPAWLPRAAHHCLLGCLYCQQACPANGPLEVVDTGLEFSAAETRSLLGGKTAMARRSESGIRLKLAWLGQPYAEPVLGRNLRALVEVSGSRAHDGSSG
ncbi:MAG: 4Fe-4S double cluster binding domain-containing protein [Acidobacteriota bacterium]